MTSLRVAPKASGATLLARPPLARTMLAAFLAVTLAGGTASPAFAQGAPQNPPPAPQAKSSADTTPYSLGIAKHHYTRAPRPLPNLFAPYHAIKIEPSSVTNSPRIEQLIHDAKLELSLQDAVELALEKDRKSTRLNSSHSQISYAVFCLKKKKTHTLKSPVQTADHIFSRAARKLSFISHALASNIRNDASRLGRRSPLPHALVPP